MRLVEQLAVSMKAGRHEPLIEVEPLPDQPGRYQIVCGEQRWRAALEARIPSVLVRVLLRLTYVERLRKQLEENRLRASLDPVEASPLAFRARKQRWHLASLQRSGHAGSAIVAACPISASLHSPGATCPMQNEKT
jgi:ParB family chromosome partitioning protein